MKTQIHRLAPIAVSLALLAGLSTAHANVVLGAGSVGDRSICPDPTFNACYIGVDGTRTATAVGATSVSFLGLGAVATETSAVPFPSASPPSTPNGTLNVGAGSSITVPGDGSGGTNTSIIVGLGNGSTGTLNVGGGLVTTPLLYIGETDARVSTGIMTVSNGGQVVASVNAVNAFAPGLTAIGIGRGAGSTGSLTVTGAGSTVSATAASTSFGRAGTASLDVLAGGQFSTIGSIYASAATTTGSTSIVVDGAGSKIIAPGRILLGVAADPTTGSQLNQNFDPLSTAHGTATLNVRNGGVVQTGQLVVGAGGTLRGNGTVIGDVAVYGGTVSPGNSPGTLHVNGNYLMSGGLYIVEIAGTGPGMTDLLDISGSATLSNATVLFSFINGFAPSAGFTFNFLDAGQGLTTSNLTFQTQGLLPGFTFTTLASNGLFAFTALTNGRAVPEPETLPLVFAGLLGAVAFSRRAFRSKGRAKAVSA